MAALLLTGGETLAQVEIERPTAGEKNAVGFAAFVAPSLTRDTFFYGVTAEYDRLLTSKWELAVSLGADWAPSQTSKVGQGLSLTLDGGYSITERLSAVLAYAKEFARYGRDTNYR